MKATTPIFPQNEVFTVEGFGPARIVPGVRYDYDKDPMHCPWCGGVGCPWGGWFVCDGRHSCGGVAFVQTGEFMLPMKAEKP